MSSRAARGRTGSAVRVAVLLGALMIILTGCVSIPRSGAVVVGEEISAREGPGVEFDVNGPVPGASQEEILRGFINAFKSSGDYDVARQFLTSGFVDEWDSREGVLVYTGRVSFLAEGTDSMQYRVTTNAAVDAVGMYTPFPPSPATLQYSFVQEGGEWRINSAPNGIVLAEGTFRAIFAQHVLYFLDPGGASLVPDLRWFPAGTATTTRVVSSLLAGPPRWLQGAVTTSFPDGTKLTSPKRVSVDSRTAMVDLTADALASSPSQRQLMRLQLEASLGRVPSVTSVSVSVNGSALEIPDPGPGLPQSNPRVDNRSLVFVDGQFGFYANGQLAPIESLSKKVAALEPTAAALSSSGTTAAVLGVGGVSIVRASQDQPLLLDARTGLVAPSLDGEGYVWSVPAGEPRGLRAYDSNGNAFDIANSLPPDSRVASIDVSRDSARLAMLLSTPSGPRLLVVAIIRDANAKFAPVSLGDPVIDSVEGADLAIDAAWLDETTIATLTSDNGSDTRVTEFQVGGMRTPLGSPGDAVSIVGGNGESASLRVLRADGFIAVRRSASGWQATQTQIDFLATQR